MKITEKYLSLEQRSDIMNILKNRFKANMSRHAKLDWDKVQAKLYNNPEKLWSLNEMEKSGGEPDIVMPNHETNEYIFYDCSSESPIGRRNLCYDNSALESRKTNKPTNNVIDLANYMGIELLSEAQYRELQKTLKCDTKTSSWIYTPDEIRTLGGALFCDYRYNHTFVYHNGAESYYSSRGFRGLLRV